MPHDEISLGQSHSTFRSIPWPQSEEIVELGIVTIGKAVSDSREAEKKLLFLPTDVSADRGIEASDDSLIEVHLVFSPQSLSMMIGAGKSALLLAKQSRFFG